MRHYRIKNKYRFTAFATVCMLLAVFLIGSVSGLYTAQATEDVKYISYQVQAGDTLWNLAKQYGPQGQDTRATVYQISALNNVNASTLQVGMVINIPVYE